MKVLVTPRSFSSTSEKPKKILEDKKYELIYNDKGRPYSKKEMIDLVKDIDGIIVGIDYLGKEVIEEANRLKVISKYGVGTDNIDIEEAAKKNIIVTNTPTANNQAVADLAFCHIMSLARKITKANNSTKSGEWERFIGNSVYKKNLGIIGLGKIGKALVKRAKGFDMNILAYDVYPDQKYAKDNDIKYVKLPELYKKSDFISVHVPLNSQTKNLIGKKEFEIMKDSAFLINTSRGGIVNEDDLYEALKNNKIKGAAMDAFINEPPKNSPLKELENIIMTSHNGAYTEEAIEKMGVQAAENLINVLEGKSVVKNRLVT